MLKYKNISGILKKIIQAEEVKNPLQSKFMPFERNVIDNGRFKRKLLEGI